MNYKRILAGALTAFAGLFLYCGDNTIKAPDNTGPGGGDGTVTGSQPILDIHLGAQLPNGDVPVSLTSSKKGEIWYKVIEGSPLGVSEAVALSGEKLTVEAKETKIVYVRQVVLDKHIYAIAKTTGNNGVKSEVKLRSISGTGSGTPYTPDPDPVFTVFGTEVNGNPTDGYDGGVVGVRKSTALQPQLGPLPHTATLQAFLENLRNKLDGEDVEITFNNVVVGASDVALFSDPVSLASANWGRVDVKGTITGSGAKTVEVAIGGVAVEVRFIGATIINTSASAGSAALTVANGGKASVLEGTTITATAGTGITVAGGGVADVKASSVTSASGKGVSVASAASVSISAGSSVLSVSDTALVVSNGAAAVSVTGNSTIKTESGDAAVVNKGNATVVISDSKIIAEGSGDAIVNNGTGTVDITFGDNSLIEVEDGTVFVNNDPQGRIVKKGDTNNSDGTSKIDITGTGNENGGSGQGGITVDFATPILEKVRYGAKDYDRVTDATANIKIRNTLESGLAYYQIFTTQQTTLPKGSSIRNSGTVVPGGAIPGADDPVTTSIVENVREILITTSTTASTWVYATVAKTTDDGRILIDDDAVIEFEVEAVTSTTLGAIVRTSRDGASVVVSSNKLIAAAKYELVASAATPATEDLTDAAWENVTITTPEASPFTVELSGLNVEDDETEDVAKYAYVILKGPDGLWGVPTLVAIPANLPPVITAPAASDILRTSKNTGKVKLVTNKPAGKVYYLVVPVADEAADAAILAGFVGDPDTEGEEASEETTGSPSAPTGFYNVEGLAEAPTTGNVARVVYFIAEDEDGLQSDPIKVTFAAAAAPTVTVASPTRASKTVAYVKVTSNKTISSVKYKVETSGSATLPEASSVSEAATNNANATEYPAGEGWYKLTVETAATNNADKWVFVTVTDEDGLTSVVHPIVKIDKLAEPTVTVTSPTRPGLTTAKVSVTAGPAGTVVAKVYYKVAATNDETAPTAASLTSVATASLVEGEVNATTKNGIYSITLTGTSAAKVFFAIGVGADDDELRSNVVTVNIPANEPPTFGVASGGVKRTGVETATVKLSNISKPLGALYFVTVASNVTAAPPAFVSDPTEGESATPVGEADTATVWTLEDDSWDDGGVRYVFLIAKDGGTLYSTVSARIEIPGKSSPTLTGLVAERTGTTEAKVKFVTNNAVGGVNYIIKESADAAPTAVSELTATASLNAGKDTATLALTGLQNTDTRVAYLSVKDADNLQSSIVSVAIGANTAPVITLTAVRNAANFAQATITVVANKSLSTAATAAFLAEGTATDASLPNLATGNAQLVAVTGQTNTYTIAVTGLTDAAIAYRYVKVTGTNEMESVPVLNGAGKVTIPAATTYAITAEAEGPEDDDEFEGGTVPVKLGSTATTSAAAGQTVSIEPPAIAGYELATTPVVVKKANGENFSPALTVTAPTSPAAAYTFAMPAEAVKVIVTYELEQ